MQLPGYAARTVRPLSQTFILSLLVAARRPSAVQPCCQQWCLHSHVLCVVHCDALWIDLAASPPLAAVLRWFGSGGCLFPVWLGEWPA